MVRKDHETGPHTAIVIVLCIFFIFGFSAGFALDLNIGTFRHYLTWEYLSAQPAMWLLETSVRIMLGSLFGLLAAAFVAGGTTD